MGACFSVNLKIAFSRKYKDSEKRACEILREFVTSERANFSLESYCPSTLDSFDGLVRICLAGHGPYYYQEGTGMFREYGNDFDASYGWEGVMIDMIELIAPYLATGSTLTIDIDDDYDLIRVSRGKCYQIH